MGYEYEWLSVSIYCASLGYTERWSASSALSRRSRYVSLEPFSLYGITFFHSR
jgi:hypothetical protein